MPPNEPGNLKFAICWKRKFHGLINIWHWQDRKRLKYLATISWQVIFSFSEVKIILWCSNLPKKNHVDIAGHYIIMGLKPDTPQEKVPEILKKWYIAQARKILNERVLVYSRGLGVEPARIAVRGQSKRWGSCSAKGNLNLNWKLVMAPPIILDYVVAHELCHLRHPNHQSEFWLMLGGLMPDYADRRDWLKQNGHKLGL